MVQSLFKTGVAAHIVGMPANTLRVWERRYGLQCQHLDEHGHRLYSADDVQRIASLRQLTLQGHAIGAVAGLSQSELRDLLSTQDEVREVAQAMAQPVRPPRQLLVVGAALATRIRRAAPRRQLRIAAALNNLPAQATPVSTERPDAVLLHLPSMHAQQVEEIAAAAQALGLPRVLVVYGYSNSQALRRCTELDIQPWRDTHNDRSLVGWIVDTLGVPRGVPLPAPAVAVAPGETLPALSAPQYDEATLADLATRTTSVACECPAHVAELLLRLQQFEAYSADCEHRDDQDRQLHEQLHRLAGSARMLLERGMHLLTEHEQALNRPPAH